MKVELYQSGPGVFAVRGLTGVLRGTVMRTLTPSEGLWIKDAAFVVDDEARKQKRTPHAFIRGELIENPGPALGGRLIKIDYRPRFGRYFFRRDTLAPLERAGHVAVMGGELYALDLMETGNIYVKLKERQKS